MHRSEDQILAEELGALGALSGGSGGLVRVVANLMRKNVHEIDLVAALPFEAVVKLVSAVLGSAGRAVDSVSVGSGEEETIRVVVGGGAGGLNPVVVTARVLKVDENSSEIWLRAAAKEGLIRQRAGERTAARIAARLSEATGAGEAYGAGKAGG